ncbi:AMP-binding enzyme [Hirsutella rhossiliensis]|uniref:AMP-binding enzyme domain-containing protein n=1 Tax=Hirsutella rhossiliensis TaxID=111463 RepID=A0A9P8MW65_9HYPO|nr:AMP-binding enzyme domain-containing protein [Hirsutella rhossiliensis]KAH0960282.1 AMP-binding enzyme domain-containing protein [Hirsutella rhossiliensis]
MAEGHALKFPHDPILVRLLVAAQHAPSSEAVVHDVLGFDKTYPQLLGDIRQMRHDLLAQLPPSATDQRGILRAETQNVAVLTRSAYEMMVGFFAIRAIGGAFVPLASGIFPEEAQYILARAEVTCLLVGRERMEPGQGHQRLYPRAQGLTRNLDPAADFVRRFALEHRRCAPLAEPGGVAISHRPAHWISGLRDIVTPMVTGTKLYALGEKADAEAVLNALRNYGITHATFGPTILRQMKDVLTGQRGELSQEDRTKWSGHFKALGTIKCSAGVLEPSVIQFWTDLSGLPFENMYGATESGGLAVRGTSTTQFSIGTPMSGVKVKLSEGSRGEIRVKSPYMFLHYLDDEEMTRAALDEDGYYKTGDLAELRDGEYVFGGRASSDYLLCGVFRIPASTVESSLADLPYVAEACIVGVPDYAAIQLCGAVVRLRSQVESQITLARIRCDLAASLAAYMLPTLLRVLKEDEELPRTASGKLLKRQILRDYFGNADGMPACRVPADVEQCARSRLIWEGSKPWDGSGLQRAV